MFEHNSSAFAVIFTVFFLFQFFNLPAIIITTVTFIFDPVQGFVCNLELEHKHYWFIDIIDLSLLFTPGGLN